MENSGWNMYVFRDGRRTVTGELIRGLLLDALGEFVEQPTEDNCIAALIAAGELECALLDAGSDSAATAGEVTDELAQAFVRERVCDRRLTDKAREIAVPGEVSISVAEGFAYYALHPRKFIDLIEQLELPPTVRVVGLRSIGTTLSAVVTAALRARGIEAERTTVRPHGHPYERELHLTEKERQWLRGGKNPTLATEAKMGHGGAGEDSLAIVVDEGPGISGSSFLAAAEAVEAAGIDPGRIVMLGSREPDVEGLRAPRGAERWRRFVYHCVSPLPLLPERAQQEMGGGLWRRSVLADFENQPACWPQLESSKYLSADKKVLFKFHGFGHYGRIIEKRGKKLGEAGFSPRPMGQVRGFGQYEFLPGRVLIREDLSPGLIQRLAEYCAFRKAEFATHEFFHELETMANYNWECEFGEKLEYPIRLDIEHQVIADGHMLPHEWLLTEDDRVLKTDAVSHGDDHFFPGPCDIAWDIAGAVIEWQMDDRASAEFVELYRVLSGDDVRRRLPEYVLAYAIFRMAWSKMAAHASAGQFDEALLMRDYRKYREMSVTAEKNRRARVSAKVA